MNKLARILWIAAVLAACSGQGAPPAPNPTVTPTRVATDPPSLTTPTEAPHGSGKITFGTKLDKAGLHVIVLKDLFKISTRAIAWSAEFSEPAGAIRLTFLIALKGSSGSEQLRYTERFDIANPDFDVLAAKEDLSAYVNRKPGTYVLRILRGATTLSEGTFRLVK